VIAPAHSSRPNGAQRGLARPLGQFVLLGVVLVTPWLFGGVLASTQAWLFVGAIVALGCWFAAALRERSSRFALPVAIVPLICAIALGVFQLVPLPRNVDTLLSPGGAELRKDLQSERTSSDAVRAAGVGMPAMAERQPISLYPASTRSDLALLVLATIVFVLGAGLFSTPRSQIWLCGLIAVNGAALAFFGLIHRLTWSNLLYWKVPLAQGGAPFGPFVNQNNAGGFLNLCLAGTVGMAVWVMGRRGPSGPRAGESRQFAGRKSLDPSRNRLLDFLSNLDGTTLTVIGLAVCIVAGILCSLSRGAGIAMVGSVILTSLLLLSARRRTLRTWCMGLIAIAALALVSWIGMSDTVQARFATLLDRKILSHSLIPHWRIALRAVPDFWCAGSGLGTYRFVYAPYEQQPCGSWFYHAENQYVEAMLVGGFVGLGLMLVTIGLVAIAGWQLLQKDSDARTFAFGIAGMLALTGQAIAAFFDFGLFIPANVLLFALLCGSICGRAAQLPRRGWMARLLALPTPRLLARVGATVLLASGVWGCLEIRSLGAVEVAMRHAKRVQVASRPLDHTRSSLSEKNHAPSQSDKKRTNSIASRIESDLSDAVDELGAAIENRPDDAEAHLEMAKLWVNLYRVRAVEQLHDETGRSAGDPDLWRATSPMVLHARAHQFASDGHAGDLDRLRREPVVHDNLDEALKHLALARRCCPLLPEVHLIMAQLCVLAVDPADDQIHIQRAQRTAPVSPDLFYRCGLLHLNAGRRDRAYQDWRRSLTLDPVYLSDILQVVGQELDSPGMVQKLLPDSPEVLVRLAQQQYAADEYATTRRLLIERARKLLGQVDLPADERHHLQAAVLALEGMNSEAIRNYRLAVQLRPNEAAWRYELALLLTKEGLLDDAHSEAKRCARMDPRNTGYRELLKQIHEARLK